MSARPRSAAVMFVPEVVLLATFVRASLVRPETPLFVTRLSRFAREFEEIERFLALTSNMSRDLFVIPASITIRMQTRLCMRSEVGNKRRIEKTYADGQTKWQCHANKSSGTHLDILCIQRLWCFWERTYFNLMRERT